jgi:acyl-CoA synthetase (AMP-forming)/AMP-acid ligase II
MGDVKMLNIDEAQGFATPNATIMSRQVCETLIEQASSQTPIEPREGSVCLTTSGTTGEPKGVILKEHQIAWTANHVRISHQLSSQDRGLTVLPFYHVNAPVVSLCASLLAGGTVIIAQRFSRRHFWSWIERYPVSWASIVPTIVAILLETEKPSFLPGTLRFVRTGSASLPAADLQAFEARFSIPVIETYGLSEAASQVAANPIPPGVHKPGSAGRPVGVDLRICLPRTNESGETLHDVAPGETGEICVAGPSIIDGYQNNSGREAFQDGWFRTGDLGYLDEDGYLFIKGRSREVINRGGENIAPREVEEVLTGHAAIREVAAVGRPDPIYGELGVAYIAVDDTWNVEAEGQSFETTLAFIQQMILPFPQGNGHPCFAGWINSAPAHAGVLVKPLAAAMNPNCGIGDHAGQELERRTVQWIMELCGFPIEGSAGVFVSGGSEANFTCLQAARQWAAQIDGWDIRAEGMQGGHLPFVLYQSDQGHFSLRKSVEAMGLGRNSIHIVPSTSSFQMDVQQLRKRIQQDREAGLRPLCVAATAGTVES